MFFFYNFYWKWSSYMLSTRGKQISISVFYACKCLMKLDIFIWHISYQYISTFGLNWLTYHLFFRLFFELGLWYLGKSSLRMEYFPLSRFSSSSRIGNPISPMFTSVTSDNRFPTGRFCTAVAEPAMNERMTEISTHKFQL